MALDRFKPQVDRGFLKGELAYEYEDYKAEGDDAALLERLRNWSGRELVRETQAEASFVQRFFVETWGYTEDGAGLGGVGEIMLGNGANLLRTYHEQYRDDSALLMPRDLAFPR